jgi:hypothetical protein
MTNLRVGQGLDDIVRFIEAQGALGDGASATQPRLSA